jgi:hypothetical protein
MLGFYMRLRTLFLIYVLSTAAAFAAPYATTAIENARRKTIPVSSESPLESVPALQPRRMWPDDGPAGSASNGTVLSGLARTGWPTENHENSNSRRQGNS